VTFAVPSSIRGIELPPFDPLNLRAAELRDQGHHVISLGQAVPFFAPPAAALDAARAALDTPQVHRYVTDQGLPRLREALAARLSSMADGGLSADDLVITAGGNHAFTLAVTTLVAPGDEVVLPSPYFTNHQMAIVARGAVPVEAPIADPRFTLRWSDLEPHVGTRTKAVVLCNPSNPTGMPVPAAEGRRLISELAARDIAVISDEAYMHFVYEGEHWSAASVAGWRRNVSVVGTFSKSFGMMGWRVGFLLADAAVCAQVVKVQDAMIICAPSISQMAALAAVSDCWTHALTFHDELRRRRAALVDGLRGVRGVQCDASAAGLFAFARVDACVDSAQLARQLLEDAHVVSIPGRAFGRAGEGCLRLSYGYANAAEIANACERVDRFLAARRA
jgi:aminotransferase